MENVRKRCNRIIVMLLSCYTAQSVFAAGGQPHDYAAFYIKNFGGSVDPETVPHVYEVFSKVYAVAGASSRYLSELIVIKDLPGPPAIVLPDGNIVLANRALEVIYDDVPVWEGNTRLAFILGHELAHLANDDSWNAEMRHLIRSKALSGEIDGNLLEQLNQDKKELRGVELKADDNGFLYAAMAGFAVETLLTPENDFLSYWVDKTNTQSSTIHPEAAQRTKLLRELLKAKRDALEFFYMGVRLAHFGRYEDAVYFFRKFQEVFPGREVLNNLGVCSLQMALKKMPPEQAYQYWLPNILDNETVLSRTGVFRSSKEKEAVENFLKDAVVYLEEATKKDPSYRIGFINLAVARFYLREILEARAAIEKARKLQPDSYEVESLWALTLFEEGLPMDTWAHAEGIFSDLSDKLPAEVLPLSFYYNWARLLEARGRSAERQWQRLAKCKSELPQPIASMLCERLKDPSAIELCLKKIVKPDANGGMKFSESLPIQLGFDAWKLKKEEHPLKTWHKLEFNWQGQAASSGSIYNGPKDDVVLEMDDIVEMVVLKQDLVEIEQLLQKYGLPRHKKTVMNSELWSYGHFAVLVDRGRIKEIWVVREQP